MVAAAREPRTLQDREEKLLALLARLGSVSDELRAHCLVYVAQEVGLLESVYDFRFDLTVPFSPELELDLMRLEAFGMLRNTNTAASLVVTERARSYPHSKNVEASPAQLELLRQSDLPTVSRILYVKASYRTRDTAELQRLAQANFLVTSEGIRRGIDVLEKLVGS